MITGLQVKGVTSLSGARYVKFRVRGITHYEKYAVFAIEPTEVKKRLAHKGIVLIGGKWKILCSKVEGLTSFPIRNLVEQAGWTGDFVALPDGTVIGPGKKAKALFEYSSHVGAQGTLAEWQNGVAKLLVNQKILSFLVMTMFAPSILHLTDRADNFGFEIVGKGGCGKSSALRIMASCCGPAKRNDGSNYWTSFNATMAGIERTLPRYKDLPLLLDEANLSVGSRASGAIGEYRQLIFKLSDGHSKATHYSPRQDAYRTIYVTTANEPIASLIAGGNAETNSAAGDRLITLMIDDRRPFGTFDFLPNGFGNAKQLAAQLEDGISNFYGTPIRHFLMRLGKVRSSDQKALRIEISNSVQKFVKAVGTDLNNGSAVRVAEAFGIVYAAGKLAKNHGVLPQGFKCLQAAKAAYQLHISGSGTSLPDVLNQIAQAPGVYQLDRKSLPEITDKEFHSSAVFVGRGKRGRTELMMRKDVLKRLRKDHKLILTQADAMGILLRDKSHYDVQRKVRHGKKSERVCVFIISD